MATMPKGSGPTAWTRGARRLLGLPRCSPRSGRRRRDRVLGCMVGSSARGRGCTDPQHGGPPVGAEEKSFSLLKNFARYQRATTSLAASVDPTEAGYGDMKGLIRVEGLSV